MSSAIVRCTSYAAPFKGLINDIKADHLIDSSTTPEEFNKKRMPLSRLYQFDLFTGGGLGKHPLAQAACEGNLEMIQSLFVEGGPALLNLGDKFGRIPLFLATSNRKYGAIEKLLNLGSPINMSPTFPWQHQETTALSVAIKLNDVAIAKLLIKYGGVCRKNMNQVGIAFHNQMLQEIQKEKADLASAIDNATGNKTFPLELLLLIADYV
jgi:ankyrin repeat protein